MSETHVKHQQLCVLFDEARKGRDPLEASPQLLYLSPNLVSVAASFPVGECIGKAFQDIFRR